ncbi:hypothetical protein [Lacinutrix sp.]|uniref:hypothetical protein n=1 Tax=Lacinutrix sp. TaxID=1937692 RepID=UPI0025C013DD|nr:hypothetical protein [Lacinutrix sp.]
MKNNYIPFIILLILTSCSNVTEEDLLEPIILEPEESINYTQHIQPIMVNNCTFCHNDPPVNGAPNSLTTYNAVVNSVNNSNLIGRISRETGESGAMPIGGPKLPQDLIDLVIQWQVDGFLEN